MTLARIVATGRGKIRARLEIEGWPVEVVTHSSMQWVLVDARKRVVGLRLDGLKLAARLSLPTGKLDAEGFRVKLVDVTRDQEILRGFRARPTARTWLAAFVSATDVDIDVFSTDGFPASGMLHIGTEAIGYSSKGPTQFNGCVRGLWGSVAQAHFTAGTGSIAFEADAAALAFTPVTDVPETLEGRRVWLHLYGEGESDTADGTRRWQGVASTCPKVEGRKISFAVDPPTAILKQQVGGDVAQPVPIRGIYYPWNMPFFCQLFLHATADHNSKIDATARVQHFGFFETEEENCASLTGQIAAAIAAAPGWTWNTASTIIAVPTADGFKFRYVTPTGGVKYVTVGIPLWIPAVHDQPTQRQWVFETTRNPAIDPLANDQVYEFAFTSPFPRSYFGRQSPAVRTDPGGSLVPAPNLADLWPDTRIYVGGLVGLSDQTTIALNEEEPVFQRVAQVNPAENSIDVHGPIIVEAPGSASPAFRMFGPQTRIRLGRVIAVGNIGTLLEELVASSPDLANSGAMPLVRAGDVDVGLGAHAITEINVGAYLSSPAVNDRAFVSFGADVTLEELIGPELVAAGLHWTVSLSGQLGARRARLASPTEPTVHHIRVDRTSDTGKKPIGPVPTVEEAATWGFISDIAYLTGFDPIEDEHTGPEVRFVNVGVRAPLRATKRLEIAQKSLPAARIRTGTPAGLESEPTQEDIAQIAKLWLGILGGTYDVLTVRVPATCFDIQLGDPVTFSSVYVPGDDGVLGVNNKVGICVGVSWDIDTMTGSLELLLHSRPIGGYAPEFRVNSQTNVGGNTWDLTLDVAAETGVALGNWLLPADPVRVTQWDSSTPTILNGTVVSATGTVARVAFVGPWAPAGLFWSLRPREATAVTLGEGVGRFTFVADASGRMNVIASTSARVFAP